MRWFAFKAALHVDHTFPLATIDTALSRGPILEAGLMLLRFDPNAWRRALDAWSPERSRFEIAYHAVANRERCPALLRHLLDTETDPSALLYFVCQNAARSVDETKRILETVFADESPGCRLHASRHLDRLPRDIARTVAAQALLDEPEPLVTARLIHYER